LKQVLLAKIKVIHRWNSSQAIFNLVSDDSLVVALAGGDWSFPRTVQRFRSKRDGHRGQHSLIVAGDWGGRWTRRRHCVDQL